jgi:hypothetical protein
MNTKPAGHILLLDNMLKTSQLYSVGLEAYVGIEVVAMSTIEEAVDYLSSNAPYIIIARSPMEERDAGARIVQKIEEMSTKPVLIILGKSKITNYDATFMDEAVDVRVLIKKCAAILGINAREMAEKDVGDFYPIKLSVIIPNLALVCPVYRKDKDMSYSLFLDKDSKLHAEIITILKHAKEEYIYVESAHRLKFVNSLMIFLAEILSDDKLSLEDNILFGNRSYNIIRDAARRMQITTAVIHATETNINTMLSIASKIPKLNEFIKLTTKDESVSLLFRHSLLTCFIAGHIIDKMEWGTSEQKIKIAFICFFSNIFLDEDSYLLVHSDTDLETLDCSAVEKAQINNHAINAAKLLAKYYINLPFGIDTIVKQHHGNRYGVGFQQSPSSVSPLALVYMISDAWVSAILKAEKLGRPMTDVQALSLIKGKYKGMMFQDIINLLDQLNI